MRFQGQLHGLTHQYEEPIKYFMKLDDQEVHMNPFIGKKIKLSFLGEITCIHCGRKVKKTFNHGSCYPCFKSLPQNDLCIVKPDLCHFEKGTCRDESFGQAKCMTPHYVYLALSSGIKVGLTRKENAFIRWVDQGAIKAIPIAELPTRKLAGELEAFLSNHLPDKTNWRKMLKGEIEERDLIEVREEIKKILPEEFLSYLLDRDKIHEFLYPLKEEMGKIKSLSLDKEPELQDTLIGIKGQYLIFSEIGVINMKKHSGYKVELEIVGN